MLTHRAMRRAWERGRRERHLRAALAALAKASYLPPHEADRGMIDALLGIPAVPWPHEPGGRAPVATPLADGYDPVAFDLLQASRHPSRAIAEVHQEMLRRHLFGRD